MRDTLDYLWNAHDVLCETLAGVGVGNLEDFDRATRGVLDVLVEFERRGRSIDYLLAKAALTEEQGMACRVLPDPEVVIRNTHAGHPARLEAEARAERRCECGALCDDPDWYSCHECGAELRS